jgi:hypothetical protein
MAVESAPFIWDPCALAELLQAQQLRADSDVLRPGSRSLMEQARHLFSLSAFAYPIQTCDHTRPQHWHECRLRCRSRGAGECRQEWITKCGELMCKCCLQAMSASSECGTDISRMGSLDLRAGSGTTSASSPRNAAARAVSPPAFTSAGNELLFRGICSEGEGYGCADLER